ncbi:MAG TPA: hypothetical protein PKN29_09825 [Candidatus Ozemobacteraceae bacterium]|nr:hypothetical protein [Candidatus Ozemobacteraceae bacterium]
MEKSTNGVLAMWVFFMAFVGSMVFRACSPDEHKSHASWAGFLSTLLPLAGYFAAGVVFSEPSAPLVTLVVILLVGIIGLFVAARAIDPDEEDNLTGQWMKALGITFILGVFSILPLGFALSVAAYSNWDRP